MKKVVFGYGDTPCLEDVDIEVHSGEFIAVTGPNGASKSTLLKLLLGLLEPWSGTVSRLREREDSGKLIVGYVPQQIASFNSGFPSKVLEFVLSGTYTSGSWLRRVNRNDRELTERSLQQIGMWEYRNRKIGELSGVRSRGFASLGHWHNGRIYSCLTSRQPEWMCKVVLDCMKCLTD